MAITEKWIKKMWYVYTVEYIIIYTEIIILNEVSQAERQLSYNITYIWNLKKDTNEHIYKTEIDSQIQICQKTNLWLLKEIIGWGER